MEISRNRKIIIFISWVMALVWMGVIFSLSAQPAVESVSLSRGLTQFVVETVEKEVLSSGLNVDNLDHFIWKNAHFFAYFVLGILVSHVFSRHGLHGRKNIRNTALLCLLYAVSDEMQ